MDGRKNNGGARSGAGRKPKIQEHEMLELLRKGWPTKDRLTAVKKLAEQANAGDRESFKVLAAYSYGKPVETKEIGNRQGEALIVRVEYGSPGEDPNDSTA